MGTKCMTTSREGDMMYQGLAFPSLAIKVCKMRGLRKTMNLSITEVTSRAGYLTQF